ncbi:MAG TPA: gephyrin-like molybdotransferase Glp [Rhizomicrobium sp.]|nr:gephyrin-like molybdotransferase Glp [Rhizomicrobium sp.]
MSQGSKPAKLGLASVAEARAAMLAGIKVLEPENTALEHALGRILADDVVASRDQPPFDVSAMDGYAVKSADTPGLLRLAGESAAGRGFDGTCDRGSVIRISTGAAIPRGADSVVIQEDVRREGNGIAVPVSHSGENVRPRGGDFKTGTLLLPHGRFLDSVGLSLAAASGLAVLPVVRRPRIAILSSGDELAAPGTTPGPWQIFDSATFGISALVRSWGGAAHRLGVARDDVSSIVRAAEQGLRDSDLLVVIGGASVGDHDHARPALMQLGLQLRVEKVAVRPGKPTWFGRTSVGSVLGLPGNPASALVCAELFLRPMLAAMQGRDPEPKFRRAALARPLPANGPREHYLRGALNSDSSGQLKVRAFEDQDSSLISVFAAANALICLPPSAPATPVGALVDVLPLDGVGC